MISSIPACGQEHKLRIFARCHPISPPRRQLLLVSAAFELSIVVAYKASVRRPYGQYSAWPGLHCRPSPTCQRCCHRVTPKLLPRFSAAPPSTLGSRRTRRHLELCVCAAALWSSNFLVFLVLAKVIVGSPSVGLYLHCNLWILRFEVTSNDL